MGRRPRSQERRGLPTLPSRPIPSGSLSPPEGSSRKWIFAGERRSRSARLLSVSDLPGERTIRSYSWRTLRDFSACPRRAADRRDSLRGGHSRAGFTKEGSFPRFLPGGKSLLVGVQGGISVVSLATGESKRIVDKGSSPRYVGSGHLVYEYQRSLYSAEFDL